MLHWTLHQDGEAKAVRAVVAVDDQVYCFGGQSCSKHRYQMNVRVFSPVSLSWRMLPQVTIEKGGERPLEIPAAGRGYTAVLIEHVIYVWGGRQRRLYAFHVDTHRWLKNEVSGNVPCGRYYHTACVLGKVMYVHGGWIRHTHRLRHQQAKPTWVPKMYKLDTSTMVWSAINAKGTNRPRSLYHSATIIGTKMYVCGSDYVDDVKVFDTKTDRWLVTTKTNLRHDFWPRHLAFAYNGELYTACSHGGDQPQSCSLRKFCPETFSWMKASLGKPKGKGPSSMTMSCCCMVGDRVVFFGGENNPDELHILNLSPPSLKTLCKLAAIQYDLEQLGLPHNIRWEMAAMKTNDNATQQEQRTNSSPGNKRKREAQQWPMEFVNKGQRRRSW